MVDRERPGDRARRGRAAGRAAPARLVAPVGKVLAVVVTGQFRAGDHRARLRQRQWLAVQVTDQVDGALTLIQVRGQPADEVGERFPAAERADRDDVRAPPEQGTGLGGGDQDPAGRPGRPGEPVVEGDRRGEVVKYHQPGPVGVAQPAEEAGRHRVGVAGELAADRGRGRRVAGQHRRAGGGGQPDDQVDRARLPQRLGGVHRQLGLAARLPPVAAAAAGDAGHQRDRGAGNERAVKHRARLRPVDEAVSEPGR